jgi:hypothetical protein
MSFKVLRLDRATKVLGMSSPNADPRAQWPTRLFSIAINWLCHQALYRRSNGYVSRARGTFGTRTHVAVDCVVSWTSGVI